jgi:hypothetical protein
MVHGVCPRMQGVVFGVSFIFIRVVVLTYYVYVYVVLMHAHWGVSEGEPSTGKVTIELAPFPLGGSHFTLSSPQVRPHEEKAAAQSVCGGHRPSDGRAELCVTD